MNKAIKYKYLWRLLCVLGATTAIIFFWQNTVLVTALLLLCAILINIQAERAEIVSYIVVAVLATLLEALAITTGAWKYTEPQILGVPLWLPLYWGMGGIVMKDIYSVLSQVIKL